MFGLLEEEIDPGVDGYNASTTTKEKHPFKLCLANTVHRERDREREREGEREREREREREGEREGERGRERVLKLHCISKMTNAYHPVFQAGQHFQSPNHSVLQCS